MMLPKMYCPCCGENMTTALPREELGSLFLGHARKFIERLARRPGTFVTIEELNNYIVADDPNGGALSANKYHSKYYHYTKPALEKAGWRIETRHGMGLRLTLLTMVTERSSAA